MTALVKSRIRAVALVLAGVLLFMAFMTMIGRIGIAHADTGASPGQDPQSLALQLYQFVREGNNLPAVGVAIMLIVYGLRSFAIKLPDPVGKWFGGTLGGYVLGFGTSALAFVGPALAAGQAVTFGLFAQAIGTGFAASGKWEGLRDLVQKLRGKNITPQIASAAIVMLLIAGLMACSGCPGVTDSKPAQDIADCTKADQSGLESLALTCGSKIPDWKAVEECATAGDQSALVDVGGCVLADLVQQYMTSHKGLSVGESQTARQTLETYRARHGGKLYHTSHGDL